MSSPSVLSPSNASRAHGSDPSTLLLHQRDSADDDDAGAAGHGGSSAALVDRAAEHYNAALTLSASSGGDGAIQRAYFLNQLLVVCGGANAADAVEILAVSFILPAAQDDLHLSGLEKGWLAGMIFAGMLIGGWVWGALADRYGRRPCLMWCLIINGLFGLLSSLSPNFALILLCRFMSGVGVGGSVPVVFTYFSEFLSRRDRGPYMVAIACCWMVGSLLTAGLAWAIIPRRVAFEMGPETIHSWRVFAFVCAWPSLICAMALRFCPESPRWLLSRGRHLEAKQVLVAMYEVNHRREMLTTESDRSQQQQEGAGHDSYVEELSTGGCSTRWCGACCSRRRKRHAYARNFIAPPPTIVAPLPIVRPASPASRLSDAGDSSSLSSSVSSDASSDSSSLSHSGSKGISYSRVTVAATHPSAIGVAANSAHEAVVVLHDDPSDRSDSGLGGGGGSVYTSSAPVAGAAHPLSDDASLELLDQCSERERWSRFVSELASLDSVPMRPESLASPVPPEASSGLAASDADPLMDAAPTSPSSASSSDATVPAGAMWNSADQGRDSMLRSRSAHSLAQQPVPSMSLFSQSWHGVKIVLRKTASLFAADSRALTLKLVSTWFFLAFAYYGLTMWMPQYFADQSAQDDSDGTSDAGGDGDGGTADAGNAMYITAVIGALSALPANLVSMWTVARYGRIKTLVSSLLLSSLCVLLVPLIASRSGAMAMLTVFSGVNTAAWNAINVATTEVYKTEVRATAFGSVAQRRRGGREEKGTTRFGEWLMLVSCDCLFRFPQILCRCGSRRCNPGQSHVRRADGHVVASDALVHHIGRAAAVGHRGRAAARDQESQHGLSRASMRSVLPFSNSNSVSSSDSYPTNV